MTNKSTKRALLTSVMALFLCFTMLLGTTFAWFTDSVTSANNVIVSGNLDVELYNGLDDSAAVVGDTTKLFEEVALWEPGAVAYENLAVANKGNLALKYQLAINFTEATETPDGKTLADVLKVAVIPGGFTGDREAAKALDYNYSLSTFAKVGELEVGADPDVYGIVIYWEPTANDNDYNMNAGQDPLEITLGVSLLATQLTSEFDSFDNQYDVEADYVAEVKTATELSTALKTGGMVKLANDVAITETIIIPADATTVLDLNGKQLSGTMAKDAGDLIVNEGTLTIIGNDAATLTNTTINGGALIINNGTMTLKGGKYVGASIDTSGYPDYAVYSTGKLTVEEGTSIISDRGALNVSGETVINGGTFEVTAAASSRALTCHTVYACGSSLTINGGDFANNYTGVSGASVICPAGSEIAIYGGNFHDPVTSTVNFNNTANFQNYMGYGKPVNVYGGTYNDSTVNENLVAGHITVENGDGTVYVVKGIAAADQSAMETAFSSGEKTVVLSAGTYEFPSLVEGATIIGQDGVVFEDTLSGTLNNVTIKNVHIKESNAQRWAYSQGTLVFENCTFEATGVYAIYYDGLNNANITYKNCTIIGWAAIGGGAEHITFDGCTIKGNGTYGVLRLYSPATIKNCTFDVANVNTTDAYQDGIHAVDCEIKVSNNTNVNGAMTDIYNLSGSGVITEE